MPLFHNQTVGIALFSCNGMLFWGFNADWDAMPDLHELVEGVAKEFARLKEATAVEPSAKQQMVTLARAEPKRAGRRRRLSLRKTL